MLLFSNDFEATPITPNGCLANPFVKEAYHQAALYFRVNYPLHREAARRDQDPPRPPRGRQSLECAK
jgi:hypothetical protein